VDLNIHPEDKIFKEFEEHLQHYGLTIMVPNTPTRKGMGRQKDTTIDYFIVNEKIKE
jgi:hypothetical protein